MPATAAVVGRVTRSRSLNNTMDAVTKELEQSVKGKQQQSELISGEALAWPSCSCPTCEQLGNQRLVQPGTGAAYCGSGSA